MSNETTTTSITTSNSSTSNTDGDVVEDPNAPWAYVQFETSVGTFIIELYYKHTPRTCYNIAALAYEGYYNNTIFHRIISNFMIQCGDPTGTGRGGTSIYGNKFEDEITRNLKHTGAGIVSMANSGPNTNGSQFFITLKPTPFLDGKHTIFGRIYYGMSIIQRIGLVATDKDDRPMKPITIYKATPYRNPPPIPPPKEQQQQQQHQKQLAQQQATLQITSR